MPVITYQNIQTGEKVSAEYNPTRKEYVISDSDNGKWAIRESRFLEIYRKVAK